MKHLFTLILLFLSSLFTKQSRMRLLFACLFFLMFTSINNVNSQILTFNFDGLTGSEVTANSNFNNSNISSSTISRGSGLTAAVNGDRFNAIDWATTSIANAISGNDYMEFTITPNIGYKFSVSSIDFYIQRSGTGLSGIALRSSVDSYATNLDSEKSIIDNTSSQLITFIFSQTDVATPVTYRLYGYSEATGGSGGPERSTAGNDIIVNGAVVLPIELNSFDAKTFKNTSILSFTTASETNNDYFNIERSADGRSFEAIGEIKGSGNSHSTLSYEFTDEKPFAGINYYRIKQTDFDGMFSYSDIKSVRHTSSGNLNITPRTTEGRLQVTSDMEDYSIDVYNVAGQQVKSFKSLSLDQYISIDDLTAGLYFIKINHDGQVETTKIVKI